MIRSEPLSRRDTGIPHWGFLRRVPAPPRLLPDPLGKSEFEKAWHVVG